MELSERIIPAPLVLNNYVNGLPKYSYEEYLLEFINLSNEFKKLSHGEMYHSPCSEAHSENDCISSKYSLDFKLIETNSYFCGLRNYSFQYSKLANGCIATHPSIKKKKTINLYLLLKCLRGKSVQHLDCIYERKNKFNEDPDNENDKEILNYLQNLTTDKNLLLYYPHVFFYEDSSYVNPDDIAKEISSDISASLKFRKEKVHKDTYLCSFTKNKFILFKENNNELAFIESIDTVKCKKFDEYLQIDVFFELWFKD